MARDIAQPLETKTHKQISKEIIPYNGMSESVIKCT